jgi:hypothetical protein
MKYSGNNFDANWFAQISATVGDVDANKDQILSRK